MFPFRYSTIFRNRWFALLWAAGIIWMALDVAGKPAAAPKPVADHPAAKADIPADTSPEMKQAAALLAKLGG
jgi:hypothetical protein